MPLWNWTADVQIVEVLFPLQEAPLRLQTEWLPPETTERKRRFPGSELPNPRPRRLTKSRGVDGLESGKCPVGDDPEPTTIADLDGKPSPKESTESRHCDPKDDEAKAAEIVSL